MRPDLPIFGIFGHHESGKTTLIEALLPRLLRRGLSVAVAKVHAGRIDVDRPGKDSDRLFRAGADVFLQGSDEGFVRVHPADDRPPARRLGDLGRRYDLVLVEGRKRAQCPKVWLLGQGESKPPVEAGEVLAVLPRNPNRAEAVWNALEAWLPRQWLKTPVCGCVLIGGRSGRMGRPKHLLRSRRGGDAEGRKTWLEHTVECLAHVTERVAVVGPGAVPEGLPDVTRLPDVPDAEGPMAGLLAAMRWAPQSSWLVAACDLPNLRPEALGWLLSTREPGVWATLPRLPGGTHVEPLLAHYDFRARALLEDLAAEGRFSPALLSDHPKVISPPPPSDLLSAWENVNTPAALRACRPEKEQAGKPQAG